MNALGHAQRTWGFKHVKTLFSDTHPAAERLLIELLRKASFSQRLRMVASLVATTHHLSWMGLCERYPNETVDASMERLVYYLYGDRALAHRDLSHLAHTTKNDKVVLI